MTVNTDKPSCSLHPYFPGTVGGEYQTYFTNEDKQGQTIYVQVYKDGELVINQWLEAGQSTPTVVGLQATDIVHWASDIYYFGSYRGQNWCGAKPEEETTTTTAPPTTTTTVAPTTTTTQQPATTTTEPESVAFGVSATLTCAQLGLTDVPFGDPNYHVELDADNDGFACDSHATALIPTSTARTLADTGTHKGLFDPMAMFFIAILLLALGGAFVKSHVFTKLFR